MKARYKNPCYITQEIINFLVEVIGIQDLNKHKSHRDKLLEQIKFSLHLYERDKDKILKWPGQPDEELPF